MSEELITVAFGSFELNGKWRPNPHIGMSAEDQFKHNFENGFMMPVRTEPIFRIVSS